MSAIWSVISFLFLQRTEKVIHSPLGASRPNLRPSILQKSNKYNFTQATLPTRLSDDDAELRHIPDYIIDYAPYVYLYSEEEYWPGLMEEHLEHTTPHINFDPVDDKYLHPTVNNLDQLNGMGKMYLQSNDDPESYPHWLGGEDNIPEDLFPLPRNTKPHAKNVPYRSPAPAVLVVVDKGDYLDAFWFFFYSFNLGNQVLGVRFGNHVGDWEHTAIRFEKTTGKPIEVFYSEHEWGAAYKWEDAEKFDDKRVSCRPLGERLNDHYANVN
jgi:hypothetical protein